MINHINHIYIYIIYEFVSEKQCLNKICYFYKIKSIYGYTYKLFFIKYIYVYYNKYNNR